ncbi:MAG: TetR/AcrR family transcriptional regulator [Bacteroidetes bacterium]|nr:TetR/AcrR family transcriptional regulator [Bacteroidota bacterium]
MAEERDEERIIDAASARFMDFGISKVTMDEIASDVGMSKKTVYKFFPSKETLLKAIVHIHLRNVERTVHDIVASEKPVEEKLVEIFALVGKTLKRLSRPFLADLQRHLPSLWKEIDTFRRERVISHLQQMFQQAKKEGVFREDVNPDLFYLIVITTIQGIMNPNVLSQQSFSAEEAFRGMFRILYEGVLTDETRKKFELNKIVFTTQE